MSLLILFLIVFFQDSCLPFRSEDHRKPARLQHPTLSYHAVFHVHRGALATTRTLSRHNWRISSCPLAVPSLDKEAKADFDWDRELPVFERTRQMVFMCTRMEKYGSVGHHFRWYLARSMRLY
jgi:hypothetical protein